MTVTPTPALPHRRRRRTRPAGDSRDTGTPTARDDAGSSSVEQILTLTLLLLIVGLIVAGGQYWHALHITQSAATRALDAARAENATIADGTAQGQASLDALGGNLLSDTQVEVTRTATEVRVQITATAAGLIPLPVRVVQVGPVERWVPVTP